MRIFWPCVILLCACSPLTIAPGDNFQAQLVWPAFVQRAQSIDDVLLRYTVRGCNHFTVEARTREVVPIALQQGNPPTWNRTALKVEAAEGGGYVSASPAADLLPSEYLACGATTVAPYELELLLAVTCEGDGRTATTHSIPVHYAPASDSLRIFNDVLGLHVLDGNRLLILNSSAMLLVHLDEREPSPDASYLFMHPFMQHQSVGLTDAVHAMAHSATQAFVGDGCLYPNCNLMTVEDPQTHAQVTTQSGAVYILDVGPWAGDQDQKLIVGRATVPGIVRRIYIDGDSVLILSNPFNDQAAPHLGGLGALGRLGGLGGLSPGVIVSRLRGEEVHVEAVLAHTMVPPTDRADAMFVTEDEDGRLEVRSLLAPHVARPLPLLGTEPWSAVWLAPEADQWLVIRETGMVLSDFRGHSYPLQTHGPLPEVPLQPAWLGDTVIVSHTPRNDISASLQAYSRADGSLVGSYSASGTFSMMHTKALSHNRVATADFDKVRVFDARANLLGGVALPEGCAGVSSMMEMSGQLVWHTFSRDTVQQVFIADLAEFGG